MFDRILSLRERCERFSADLLDDECLADLLEDPLADLLEDPDLDLFEFFD